MAESMKFEVGERIDVDGHEDVLIIGLSCPLCVAEGKAEPVATAATQAWRPSLDQLKRAVEKQPPLGKLIEETGKGERSRLVCGKHGLELRKAGIWTQMFHLVLQRARERRQEQRLGSIAARLGGEQVAEIRAVVAESESLPTGNPRGRKGKDKRPKEGGGRKFRTTKGRDRELQEEIEEGRAKAKGEN